MATTVNRICKLSQDERDSIPIRHANGDRITDMAREYGVTLGAIRYHLYRDERNGTCNGCGIEITGPAYWRSMCLDCFRPIGRFSKYGMSESDYDIVVAMQNGRCAICSRTKELMVDHDHKTGQVRGLLCTSCNSGIGLLQDDPDIIINAMAYLGF